MNVLLRNVPSAWATAACLLLPLAIAAADAPSAPLDRFRKLEFSPAEENFEKGWRERVAAEFDVVNDAKLDDLRAALKDENLFVRSIAARTLGIRGDKESAAALAELVKSDPEHVVRIRAVEALGLLKLHPEAIELARKDAHLAVQWSANLAARQLDSPTDDAAVLRKAFAAGIEREKMGTAQVGKPAPDFVAQTEGGKPFRLSDVIGKKPIAIYFAAFDG
jgi:HEAT repeat protein